MTINALHAAATAPAGELLTEEQIRAVLREGLRGRFAGARVLALIPDHTRSLPLPFLFREVVATLADVKQLDFMVALGTHPPLSEDALNKLVGITAEQRAGEYGHIGIFNHDWENPDAFATIGVMTQDEVKALAGDLWHPSLGGDVPIRINRRVQDYDALLILGPTFPHEVVGFSGGAKYLFPGISGPEMINVTHWLGALATILNTIGVKDTPVRAMIHAAAARVKTPITLASMVVIGEGLAGLFVGDHLSAWHAAADLSSERHIRWVDTPFQRVLSRPAAMYDELWTAAKAMYKLEPAIADGGEVIVYAPHLNVVSHVHGRHIFEAGYHIRDFYLQQWERYGHLPLGVLAHGTHLRGSGTYENGVERGRINVTLATGISRADTERLALGYLDPATVEPEAWEGREDEGVLYVPKAGEILYRVRGDGT
jgi:nickel-dependent lactate racemase